MATPNDLNLYISHLSPYSYKAWAALAWSGLPFEVTMQKLITRYTVLQRQRWLHDELEQFLNHLPPGALLAAPDLMAQLHTLCKDAQLALQRAPKGSGGEVLAD